MSIAASAAALDEAGSVRRRVMALRCTLLAPRLLAGGSCEIGYSLRPLHRLVGGAAGCGELQGVADRGEHRGPRA